MDVLKSKHLNDWPLFYWIAALDSAAVVAYLPTQDLSTPVGVSEMIQCSVRCCVPFLYLAFAASSINVLASSPFSRWLLRNRRYIGLSFAAGMGWQLLFILWMLLGHREYFMEEVYWLPDLIFQVPGYLFLFAMGVTSFHPIHRKMNGRVWRALHWVGIYFLGYTVGGCLSSFTRSSPEETRLVFEVILCPAREEAAEYLGAKSRDLYALLEARLDGREFIGSEYSIVDISQPRPWRARGRVRPGSTARPAWIHSGRKSRNRSRMVSRSQAWPPSRSLRSCHAR